MKQTLVQKASPYKRGAAPLAMLFASSLVAGCANGGGMGRSSVPPGGGTIADTPLSACLTQLATVDLGPNPNLPVISVGEVADKTNTSEAAANQALAQGVTEMVINAFYKTGKVRLTERWDIRVALAEVKMVEQNLIQSRRVQDYTIRPSDFIVMGALTEMTPLSGQRSGSTVVGLDLRVVNAKTFDVTYATTIRRQGSGTDLDAVRGAVEASVYQIMTDYLGLPATDQCRALAASTGT